MAFIITKNISIEGKKFKVNEPMPEGTSLRIQRYLNYAGVLATQKSNEQTEETGTESDEDSGESENTK